MYNQNNFQYYIIYFNRNNPGQRFTGIQPQQRVLPVFILLYYIACLW